MATKTPRPSDCRRPWNYWRDRWREWPSSTVRIGGQTYSAAQFLSAVQPGTFDASVILARHLAAVKLSAGPSGDAQAQPWIGLADVLLASAPGQLPKHVTTSSVRGRLMFVLAATLEAYTHHCGPHVPRAALMSRTGLVGDIDDDCHVSVFDMTLMARGFYSSRGSERYDPKSDLNENGSIDIGDIQIAGVRFAERC